MMHKSYTFNLLIISLLCIFNSSVDILDVSDFRFYYKTYYYTLDSSQSQTAIYYNNELQVNITIDFTSNIITLISNDINNNIIELNALNESNWDEISNIHFIESVNNNTIISDNKISSSRSLLACAGSGVHSTKCSRMMQRMRMMRRRKQTRLAFVKAYKQRQRMRNKWKQRLKRIRRRKDTKLKIALRHLKKKEDNAGDEFGWIADILQRKTEWYRRRIIDENEIYNNIISLCKVLYNKNMNKHYEICLQYYIEQDIFLSFEIKLGEKKILKMGDNKKDFNYRDLIDSTHEFFVENEDEMSFNPIVGSLGYMINKYEAMDWHSFDFINSKGIMKEQYEYGEFNRLNNLIHYFDEYELDIEVNNMYIKCGEVIEDLAYKMCMKIVKENGNVDVLLYFEKDENYNDEILYIDDGFRNVYSFDNDDNWSEINVIYLEEGNESWFKKCSNKLIIAKVCIEQFDEEYYRATIKLKSTDAKRNEQN